MLAAMASLLKGHDITSSLVHGDLWSGNARMLASGEAVVFDPAVYIGDREVDVAMKDLFGGFGAAFADSYAKRGRSTTATRLGATSTTSIACSTA